LNHANNVFNVHVVIIHLFHTVVPLLVC